MSRETVLTLSLSTRQRSPQSLSPLSLFSTYSLVIRGDQDERAVLCSEDKTYDLKIADTSNLLLLVPGCLTPDQLTTDNQASSQLVHAQVGGVLSTI